MNSVVSCKRCIMDENIPNDIEVTHISLNDNTIEGISCPKFNAFSVQHHPEASPGPHDAKYLFENFITSMKKEEVHA